MLIEQLRKHNPGRIGTVKKKTTRPRRVTDQDYEFDYVEEINLDVEEWAFESVGNKYALDVCKIEQLVSENLCVVMTCTDKTLAKKLKLRFDACYAYVHREMSNSDLIKLMRDRGTTSQSEISSRIQELENSIVEYTKNILLYDAVIINSSTPALAIEAASSLIFFEKLK